MRSWSILLVFLLASACATVGGTRSMPLDRGVERRFQTDLTDAAIAARNAVAASSLGVFEFTALGDSVWIIIARPVQSEGANELVRLVCQHVAPGEVAVRIVTRRRAPLSSVIRSDWSATLFTLIALELGQQSRAKGRR